jgi:hypothetical protein
VVAVLEGRGRSDPKIFALRQIYLWFGWLPENLL